MNQTYRLIKKEIKTLLPYQLATFLLAAVHIYMSVRIISFMQEMIDKLGTAQALDKLAQICRWCVVYAVVMIIFQLVFKRTQAKGANEVTMLLFRKLQGKSYEFYQKHDSGEIISLINNEGKDVGNWLSSGVLVLFNEFILLLFNLYMMVRYNWLMTVLICMIMLVCFFSTKVVAAKVASATSDSLKTMASANKVILETHKLEQLVQMLDKRDWFIKRFNRIIMEEKYPADNRRADCIALYQTIFAMVSIIVPVLAVVFGVIFSQKYSISVGMLIAFYSYTVQIQEPVRYIPEFLSTRKSTITLAEHLTPILMESNLSDEDTTQLTGKVEKLEWHIDGFRHTPSDKELLRNLDVKIHAGEVLLIKGASGSGKTTLLNLLMGFIKDERAKITFNDIAAEKMTDSERWRHMLISSQLPLLLEGTIRQNIFLGDSYEKEQLIEVMDTCCLSELLDEKEELIIGGENDKISGGQKQRINTARILIRKPDVIILDEPTASLDALTAQKLARNVVAFTKKYNLMLIVVSHNQDFDEYADKLLQL